MASVDDLVVFLRARLDERAEKAKHIHNADPGCPAHWEYSWGYEYDPAKCACGEPNLVLADVDAKRRMVDRFVAVCTIPEPEDEYARGEDNGFREACRVALCELAASYTGHPDYRERWKP